MIVTIILGVMGASQLMSRRRGLELIAVSAEAVSLATYWMAPGRCVFFGILHHIALANALIAGALFLLSPALVILVTFFLAASEFLAHLAYAAYAADWLLWVGLALVTPPVGGLRSP